MFEFTRSEACAIRRKQIKLLNTREQRRPSDNRGTTLILLRYDGNRVLCDLRNSAVYRGVQIGAKRGFTVNDRAYSYRLTSHDGVALLNYWRAWRSYVLTQRYDDLFRLIRGRKKRSMVVEGVESDALHKTFRRRFSKSQEYVRTFGMKRRVDPTLLFGEKTRLIFMINAARIETFWARTITTKVTL